MRWYNWKWWRLARSRNTGVITDGDGRWVNILPGLFLLTVRRAACPLGEPTMYKQVYQTMMAANHDHAICVETAIEAVEQYGGHRALSQKYLNEVVEECKP